MVNPEQRMTPEQALQHPWISDNKSTEPISDITKNMKTFKASRSQVFQRFCRNLAHDPHTQASLCEDDEDEDED